MKKIFTVLGIAAVAVMANAQIVINEVYGGGGNSGATLKNDFIELYNRGTSDVTLTGAYIQYGSSTGSMGGTGTTPTIYALPTPITIPAGKFYLIQAAAGTGGTTNLPTPDAQISAAMSGTGGKVALTTSATPVTTPTDPSVVDFVGWGTGTTPFEGAGPAPATTNSTSIQRTPIGTDTNDNSKDFGTTSVKPTPTNSKNESLATSEVGLVEHSLIKNTLVDSELTFATKSSVQIFDANGHLVRTADVKENDKLNVSGLAKGVMNQRQKLHSQ